MQGHRDRLYNPMTGSSDPDQDEPMLQLEDETIPVAFEDNVKVLEDLFNNSRFGTLHVTTSMQETAMKLLMKFDCTDKSLMKSTSPSLKFYGQKYNIYLHYKYNLF